MKITRRLAIEILKYLDRHRKFYFPFVVVNKEYGEDGDFVEIDPDMWKMIEKDNNYRTFQLWENLQNLDIQTLKLMSKSFLEKITNTALESRIYRLIRNYKNELDDKSWECHKSEDYGFNEFIEGKIEAYEECLEIIRERV